MSFDFHARYGLLTYSQCADLDPHGIVCLLGGLGAECIIGKESHQDGGVHLHAFFDFGRKRRFRRADVFDISGCHPNIEGSRGTPWLGWDYATKDGDVVGGGLERPTERPLGGGSVSSENAKWSQIVAAKDRDEFFQLCRDLAPKSLCTSFPSLSKYADWTYRPRQREYTTPGGTFDLEKYPELSEWSEGIASHASGTRGKRFYFTSLAWSLAARQAFILLRWARIRAESRGFAPLESHGRSKHGPLLCGADFTQEEAGLSYYTETRDLVRQCGLGPWETTPTSVGCIPGLRQSSPKKRTTPFLTTSKAESSSSTDTKIGSGVSSTSRSRYFTKTLS